MTTLWLELDEQGNQEQERPSEVLRAWLCRTFLVIVKFWLLGLVRWEPVEGFAEVLLQLFLVVTGD
jgi:hypothetical protein